MQNLNYYKEIIKQKRKSTNFRDYLKEIASHFPLTYYRQEGLITTFPKTSRIPKIIDNKEYSKLRDELIKSGINYNNSISFFDNYEKLFLSNPIFNLLDYGGTENNDFADMVYNSKNVYLSTAIILNCENVLYSVSVKDNSKDVFNSLAIWSNSSIIYKCSGVVESFKIFYSRFINNSNNIWFSSNLVGCSECIFCNDLDNESYCINNKKLEKEEYFEQKEILLKDKVKFDKYYSKVEKKGQSIGSTNITGSAMFNSENVENGYFGYNVKNAKNAFLVGGVNGDEEMYDVFTVGSPTAHDFYGVMGANGDNLYCCKNIIESSNLFYSYNLDNCSFCIGCIGLKNKSYCILNKQYTKEEYQILADKIFSKMEKEGTLGDFFPGKLNPFYFNDTVAGLIGGFKKEEVEKEGYMWRDEEIKVDIPEGVEVIMSSPQPSPIGEEVRSLDNFEGFDNEGNWMINPEILKVVIVDEKGDYYRIVKYEYDFLVKYELPLPRLHWMNRIKLGFGT